MKRRPIAVAVARERARRAAEFLARDERVRLVFLFGSAADPDARSARDVDLAILSRPPLELDELMRLRADLVAAAGAGLDLVSLNDASVVLAKEVANGGRCLFARTPEEETDFVVRARSRFWDWKPFLETQWRLTGERLAARLVRGQGDGPQA
ncbi:MAG: nucleotidyltransferase domain-containing protein [Acidobacteria bacterium]|nr:MAG: nucleotidyltransferase domain-containing protein [Acidobacteriota bacterium]